jgi:hypothetical protein
MVNGFIEKGNLKGRKMASTSFRSNCPSWIDMTGLVNYTTTVAI